MTRQLQQIISFIETEWNTQVYPSFAYTVERISNGQNMDNKMLHKKLKQKHSYSGGNIQRVVSKRMYNAAKRSDNSIVELVTDVANLYETDPKNVSDDQLCRGLQEITCNKKEK